MRNHYHSIYLSPHLDDAALSCGGRIFAKTSEGKSVLIVTVMAGDAAENAISEFARSLHEQWELISDTVAKRRAEDVAACRILGTDYIHWEIPDCIYRRNPVNGDALYHSWQEVFGAVNTADIGLIDSLASRITALPAHEELFVPLTVGNHVDHQIVRAAAEKCAVTELLYYEDYPYVRVDGALDAVLPPNRVPWRATAFALSQTDIEAKIEAIAAFASQVGSFFADRPDLERQIQSYAQRVGGERVWRHI